MPGFLNSKKKRMLYRAIGRVDELICVKHFASDGHILGTQKHWLFSRGRRRVLFTVRQPPLPSVLAPAQDTQHTLQQHLASLAKPPLNSPDSTKVDRAVGGNALSHPHPSCWAAAG